ncbi:MAG: hypothetical protein ACRD8O_22130, partial [Bryobacteraceae bacterium]
MRGEFLLLRVFRDQLLEGFPRLHRVPFLEQALTQPVLGLSRARARVLRRSDDLTIELFRSLDVAGRFLRV